MWKESLGLKGYFKIQSYDLEGNLIDSFEENNLIMDKGRNALATFCSGFATPSSINRFAIGTMGSGDTVLDPKVYPEFNSTLTSLFSEQSSSAYEYYIDFIPTTSGELATVMESDVGAGSTLKVTLEDSLLSYEITLSASAANNGSSVPYTEACFYAGTEIFAMRCFPVRVKDATTRLVITWQFQF